MTRLFLTAAALVAGACAAFQSGTNARLASHLGLGKAILINSAIALVASVALYFALPARESTVPPWHAYLGGVCGFAIITSMAFLFPRLGAAAAIALFVLGSGATALTLDYFSKVPVTLPRLAGLTLLVAGVVLLNWKR